MSTRSFTPTTGRARELSDLAVLSGRLGQDKVNLVVGRHLGLVAPMVKSGLLTEREVEAVILYHMSEVDRNRWMQHSSLFTAQQVTVRNLPSAIQAAVARFGDGYNVGKQTHEEGGRETHMAKKVPSEKEAAAIALRNQGGKGSALPGDGTSAEGGKTAKAKAPKEPKPPRTQKQHAVVALIACGFCGAAQGDNCFGKLQEGQDPKDRKRVALPHAARIKAAQDAGLLPKPEGAAASAVAGATAQTPTPPAESVTGAGVTAGETASEAAG